MVSGDGLHHPGAAAGGGGAGQDGGHVWHGTGAEGS